MFAGWCDFAQISTVTDEQHGFTSNDTVVVLAEILVLNETVSFTREAELAASASTAIVPVGHQVTICMTACYLPHP
jgi:hypothetical protein